MGKLVETLPSWKSRIKTWDRKQLITSRSYYRSRIDQPWSVDGSWEVPVGFDEGYLLGTTIPDFRRLMKSGVLLPHTNFEMFELNARTTSARWYVQNAGNEGNKYEPHAGWLNTYKPTVEHLKSVTSVDPWLIQRAAAKIYSRGFDALTFMAELSQSVSMLGDLAKKYRNLLEMAKGRNKRLKTKEEGFGVGNRERNSGNSESASDWYLEARYGWRPLLNDIRNIVDLIQQWSNKLERNVEKSQYQHETINVTQSTASYYYGTLHVTSTDSLWYSRVGSVAADMFSAPITSSVLLTAWEKVPLSFVADWIIHVGQLIAAASLQDIALRTTSSAGYAVRLRRHVSANLTPVTPFVTDCGFEMDYEAMYKLRLPMPIPQTPQISANLNLYKVIDAILLTLQRLK